VLDEHTRGDRRRRVRETHFGHRFGLAGHVVTSVSIEPRRMVQPRQGR
jgi:hypothetical protein